MKWKWWTSKYPISCLHCNVVKKKILHKSIFQLFSQVETFPSASTQLLTGIASQRSVPQICQLKKYPSQLVRWNLDSLNIAQNLRGKSYSPFHHYPTSRRVWQRFQCVLSKSQFPNRRNIANWRHAQRLTDLLQYPPWPHRDEECTLPATTILSVTICKACFNNITDHLNERLNLQQ